ncbi:MAG: ABC-2 family transporter protein [Ardenticatenaceae bacterium]|nr:ABC-2 family transporter protein [Ardenticatenaceae bacterium]
MSRITHWLRVYGALFRASFGVSVTYRAQLVIWVLSGILPLIMMTVWITVAQDQPGGQINGFDQTAFISYYLAVTIVRRLTGVWIIWDIDEDIRQGTLSAKLLRPLHPTHNYLTMAVTDKPVELLFILPPVALAAWLTGAQYNFSPQNMLLFGVAIIGAVGIEFGVTMAIGALAFWITQMMSVMEVWFFSRAFFSGWIIPIAMFPDFLQDILLFLPYRYVLSFPIELLLGRLNSADIGLGFVVQWGWVAFLFLLFPKLWRRGVSKYSAVGA